MFIYWSALRVHGPMSSTPLHLDVMLGNRGNLKVKCGHCRRASLITYIMGTRNRWNWVGMELSWKKITLILMGRLWLGPYIRRVVDQCCRYHISICVGNCFNLQIT